MTKDAPTGEQPRGLCHWCGLKFDGRMRPPCEACQRSMDENGVRHDRHEQAAIAAHNVWAAYTAIAQGRDTATWEQTDEESRALVRLTMRAVYEGRVRDPRGMHDEWMRATRPDDGEHSCMMPYEELPTVEKCKDALMLYAIIGVLGIDIAE